MQLVQLSYNQDKSRVMLRLTARVDRAMFDKYKSLCDKHNAKYNPAVKTQVAVIDVIPALLRDFTLGGITFGVDQNVFEDLNKIISTAKTDSKFAEQNLASKEVELAKEGRSLFPFQRTGVLWLSQRRKAMLNDQMGLGKTIQGLMSLPSKVPVVVVCPAVAKRVWQKECIRWRPEYKATVLSGRGSFVWPQAGEMVITNYDILPDTLPDNCPENVVLLADEAHALKNKKAIRHTRFQALKKLVLGNGGKTWLFTGSPLLNNPMELWNILDCADLNQEAFGTKSNFMRAFNISLENNGWATTYAFGIPTPEAPELLKRVALQRKRLDVLPDLPGKLYNSVDVDIKDKSVIDECDRVVNEMRQLGCDISNVKEEDLQVNKLLFTSMTGLRAKLATAKIPAMLEIVEDYEENKEPLVVFSAHRAPVDLLEKREGWKTITGDTSELERSNIVDEFQSGKLKGLGITIKAGGVALTLTHAAHALFVDLEWTPALNEQAEDRLARIGQKRGVIISRLKVNHLLENRIYSILTKKQDIIRAGFDAAKDTTHTVVNSTLSQEQPLGNEVVSQIDFDQIMAKNTTNVAVSATNTAGTVVTQQVKFRHAINPLEVWAEKGLLVLSGHDRDMAREQNGVGFNKFDTMFGNNLAEHIRKFNGLTDKQWDHAIKMCLKYSRQIGQPPTLE
jgi:SNF2 family DNA or RNA helicase